MKLYEINEAIEACIDIETGEILDEKKLEELQVEREEKIRNIALWIKNLRSDEKQLKEERDAFDARMKSAKRRRESLEAYLSNQLNGESVKDKLFAISWRASKYVNPIDESKIPDEWWKKPEPTLMKAEMLAAMKEGAVIPGAELAERQSMTVR